MAIFNINENVVKIIQLLYARFGSYMLPKSGRALSMTAGVDGVKRRKGD